MKKFWITIFFILTSKSWAVGQPSYFLVEKIVEPRTGLENLYLTTQVRKLQDGQSIGVQFTTEIYYDLKEGMVYAHAYDEDRSELYRFKRSIRKASPQVKDKKNSLLTYPDYLAALYLESDPEKLVSVLKKVSIPVKTPEDLSAFKEFSEKMNREALTLKRWDWEKGHAWIVDGFKTGESESQLWVMKDRFLVVKFVVDPGKLEGEEPHSVQFEDFLTGTFVVDRKRQTFSYPKVMSVVDKEQITLQEEVLGNLRLNSDKIPSPLTKLGKDKFIDIDKVGLTDEGQTATPDMKKLLNFYFRYLR